MFPLTVLFLPTVFSCMATRPTSTPSPSVTSCPSCDVSTLSASTFQSTDSMSPGTAYFLRGVDPTNWCDTAQINCIPEDGSRQTVQIDVIVDGTRTQIVSGCASASSATNTLQCNTANQWTYNSRTDFTVECRVLTGTC